MIVRFRKPRSIQEIVKSTKIKMIRKHSSIVEIEFEELPTQNELREIASLLGKPIIEINVKSEKISKIKNIKRNLKKKHQVVF